MTVRDLTPYIPTEDQFRTYTLDPKLAVADQTQQRTNVLNRAARILEIYGPYDDTKTNFRLLIQEAMYMTAELAYHYGQQVRTVVSPVKSERIGSYAYDTGFSLSGDNSTHSIVENNALVMGFIIHLKDNSTVPVFSTEVFHHGYQNSETGRGFYFDGFSDRVAYAIQRGLVGSETEYLYRVYGSATGAF